MMTKADLDAIRDTIKHTGEVRFHILYSRSNLTVTCRMWHHDGVVMGRANGGGYDRAGAALGQAIEKLFPEELCALKPRCTYTAKSSGNAGGCESVHDQAGLYGLTKLSDGRMVLDGSCGLECMLKVLEALGFKVDDFHTGPSSRMILGRREDAQSKRNREALEAVARGGSGVWAAKRAAMALEGKDL